MWIMQKFSLLNAIIDDAYYWLLRDDDTHITEGENIQSKSLWVDRLQIPNYSEWEGNYNTYVVQDAVSKTQTPERKRKQNKPDAFQQGFMQHDDIIGEWIYADIRETLDGLRNRVFNKSTTTASTTRRLYKNGVLDLSESINNTDLRVDYYKSGNDTFVDIYNMAFTVELTDREQNLIADGGALYFSFNRKFSDSPFDFGLPIPYADSTSTQRILVDSVSEGDGVYSFATDYTISDIGNMPTVTNVKNFLVGPTLFFFAVLRSVLNED